MDNNINKANNNLSPSLNKEKQKRQGNITLEIRVLVWNRHKKVAGSKFIDIV